MAIPGDWAADTLAGGIALHDLNRDGTDDIVVFEIRSPISTFVSHQDATAYYRVGLSQKTTIPDPYCKITTWNGRCEDKTIYSLTWSDPIRIDDFKWDLSQGGGIAIFDVNGNGSPDLVTFHLHGAVDQPYYRADAAGYYRIGWNVNASGTVTGGWSAPMPIDGYWGLPSQDRKAPFGALTFHDINSNGRPDLFAFHIEERQDSALGSFTQDTAAYHRFTLDLAKDGTAASPVCSK